MKDKDEAIKIYIMIVSVLKMIDKPNGKVSDAIRTIYNGLKRTFLKRQKGSSIRIADTKYVELNDEVIKAWDITRKELVNKDKPLESSLSEIIQVLWDRMGSNKYQFLYTKERRMVGVINSIKDCPTNEKRTEQQMLDADNNARKLANRFLELSGIKPRHNLATRKKIIEMNGVYE